MIVRNSAALLSVLLATANNNVASAYFAQANNAHVEFAVAGSAAAAGSDNDNNSALFLPILERALAAQRSSSSSETTNAAESMTASAIMEMFENWTAEFGKEYNDLEEKGKRMLIWLENHVMIETHNAKSESSSSSSSFTLGHNEFSDLAHAEFRERTKLGEFAPGLVLDRKKFNFMEFDERAEEGGEAPSDASLRGADDVGESAVERSRRRRRLEGDEDEASRDWHGRGLTGPVRNQGICGACWAFSAVGSIESAMAIDKYDKMTPGEKERLEAAASRGEGELGADLGLVVPLSEQDLIDCDTAYEKGCDGGLMTTAFDEEEHRKGICSEADYPYLQTQGTCAADLCTPVPGSVVKDRVDVVPRKNDALVQALKIKPVTAAMVATDPMFQFYRSGIYQAEGCGRVTKSPGDEDCAFLYEGQDVCLPDINHGVLVVGYGKDPEASSDIKTFFKVKNSWGEGWGDGGYFKIARYEVDKTDPLDNWGECAILSLLSYPVME